MDFGKTRTFVFREIGILWSSLRITFPKLRFKDFPVKNIRKYFTNKKMFGRNFFARPKNFLFGNF